MYLIYLLLIMPVLQSVLFYVPGLLLIGVVLYAAYSFVQYRRTRKAYSGVGQEPHDSGAQTSGSGNSRKDVIDVEYTEHELKKAGDACFAPAQPGRAAPRTRTLQGPYEGPQRPARPKTITL